MEGEQQVYVRVLYNFDYTTKETKLVSIRQGEKLELLKQTNSDWWQVRRDDDSKPFYVPATYVREIPPPFINPLIQGQSVQAYNKHVKIIPKHESTPPKCSPLDYQNISALNSSPESPRNDIEIKLRSELIRGNFNNPNQLNDIKKVTDRLQETSQIGNLVNDIKVQQKVSQDNNRGVGNIATVSFQPSIRGDSRSYSVINPVVPKKPPIPCPRIKELSKSLETLAEEIQFTPNPSETSWKNGETSDYHTPSPDYLDNNDMFSPWQKRLQHKNEDNSADPTNVQRSSSFRITRWPSRKKKRERKRAEVKANQDENSEEETEDNSHPQCRSLESLIDSGAEACSSSSYEWDRSGEISEGALTPQSIPAPIAFRNYVYRSSDESESEQTPRPRSISDTPQPNLNLLNPSTASPSSKSDTLIVDQPRPLISLKRNQKLVGCRRRPALRYIPSSNNANEKRSSTEKEVILPRAPRFPPTPAPHETPLRVLPGGWAEFYCSDAGGSGRVYYFHALTGDRSWKPPRTRRSGEGRLGDELSAPEDSIYNRSRSPSPSTRLVLPPGWEELYDEELDLPCYIHKVTGAKWFSSSDREGRLYFFEENSNESSWTLPDEPATPNTSPTVTTPSDITTASSFHSPKDKESASSKQKSTVSFESLRQGVVAQKAAEAERRLAATEHRGQHSGNEDEDESPEDSSAAPHIRAKLPPGALLLPAYPGFRVAKTLSMVIVEGNKRNSGTDVSQKSATMPQRIWPQLWEAGMTVLKEGQLNKTRLTENGKKLRKNWAPSHVVLTELLLLFFRDNKSFSAMRNGIIGDSKPEQSIDLNGATVETGEKFSSRKNVFVVTTTLGQQILCQEENITDAHSWFHQVSLAIKNLQPSGDKNTTTRVKLLPSREGSPQIQHTLDYPPEEKNGVMRSKSLKVAKKDTGSIEDLKAASSANAAEQTKIKARLKKFFVRRPTMESLVKKGIWKDEPAFGSYLTKLCCEEAGQPQVPIFVQRCIAAIESKPENMKTDGLYRASGNLSQVQKIRLQVDQNNLDVLDQEEDVHVLTGALKLFFRELKEPLIPYDAFNKALKASTNPNKKEKLQQFQNIVRNLPTPNYDTLAFLLQHLLRVTAEQASNRMHIPNLSIVFGPTLMWPEEESLNMALDLMQQSIVIESLLQEFDAIFR